MRVFIFVITFLIGLAASAQQKADSLRVIALVEQSVVVQDEGEAIQLAKEASSSAQKLGIQSQVYADNNLVDCYFRFDQVYDGLRAFLELNAKLEKAGWWPQMVSNYEKLGAYYEKKKLYANAVEDYNKAAEIAREKRVPIDFWVNRMKMADLYLNSGKTEQAIEYYTEALNWANVKGQSTDERRIISYRKLANAYNYKGDFDNAINANLKALEIMEMQGLNEAYTVQLNNIGYSYQKHGETEKALSYFEKTLVARKSLGHDDGEQIPLLINIGISYQNLHMPNDSRTYLNRAIVASKQIAEKAQINDLIAMAYLADDDVIRARSHNNESLRLAKNSGDKLIEANAYLTSSIIHEKMLAYSEALADYKKFLSIKDSLATAELAKQQELLQAEYAIERTQGEIQGLINSNQIKDFEIQQLRLEAENSEKEQEIEQARAKAKLQALQLERSKLEAEKKEREVAVLKAREENQRLQYAQQKLQEEKAVQDLAIAEEKNRVQKLQLDKRKAANRSLFIILIVTFIAICIMIYAWFTGRKKNKQLAQSRELIKQERDRSDDLLLNILPESTAKELKEKGRAAPRNFESATVFFSDFKEFSSLSKDYQPEELLAELEMFFDGFDKIIAKYGIEKIKTIGDAYMCASGIPLESEDHALKMVKAAMEMITFTEQVHKQQIANGKKPWFLRIGINTGPVVAGVIGSNKFIYDVWGDTVNLASRLETAGEPGKINISQLTLDLIKDQVRTSYRGEIEVKNMGTVRMFFVEGLRNASAQ